jgi:hypothetical protein
VVIEIVSYVAARPQRFAELGAEPRRALGDVALRIDHIGATAVSMSALRAPSRSSFRSSFASTSVPTPQTLPSTRP